MARKGVIFSQFDGGIATDLKTGIKYSFGNAQALDFRKQPSQLTPLAQPAREDANVMQDLVVDEAMTTDGTIYAYGNTGYLYKRTTSGVWSQVGKLGTSGFGEDYRVDTDAIYLTGTKTASMYTPISGTPLMYPDYFATSQSLYSPATQTPTVNPNQSGSTATTLLQTTISELTPARRLFQSDIEPLQQLSVYIPSGGVGSGDWTITVHDGLNNVLGTSTVTHASLTANAWNNFPFTNATNGQVRLYVKPNARTYHFHLTSTVADGYVSSSTNNNMSTCDMELWADRLVVTKNGLHPMGRFLQYELIGNGNYVSVWEPLSMPPTNDEWLRHRIVLPMEYEVCGIDSTDEFAIIAAEQTTTSSTSTPQQGLLIFWDGTSATYNYSVPIPEGSPLGLHTYKNVAYYYCDGAWWSITAPTTQPVKLRTMPGSDTEFSNAAAPIVVYPNSGTVRRGIQLMAWPSTTTNTSINFGVYSWGAVDKNFPDSFGYSYVISTGSKKYTGANNLTLGMARAYGDLLHISWRDDLNGGYGIDKVDNSSLPATTTFWESLVFDNGWPGKQKSGLYVQLYYKITSGVTITPRYNINQEGWIICPQAYSTTNLWLGRHSVCEFAIDKNVGIGNNDGRFYDIQVGFDLTCDATVTVPPQVQQVMLAFDDNSEEGVK